MSFLDTFYQKINGCYFAFLGAGTSLLSIFIAYILFIQVDPSFTIFTHFISDLGDGPNGSNLVFNIGIIIGSFISIFFYIFLTKFLINHDGNTLLSGLGLIFGIVSFIGGLLVGSFPSATAPLAHRVGALMSFGGSFFISIFYSLAELTTPNFNKKVAVLGFLIAPFPIMFLLTYLFLHFPGINSTIPIFIEWLSYFTRMAWIFTQSIYIYKLQLEKKNIS
ncbi:MAG: DUF998 domain-containing protein [Promethearchaeota archaeon]|nr:MAG: DUF998 domain-containing protein [Candidatus Lokiarchaeota archaeon]